MHWTAASLFLVASTGTATAQDAPATAASQAKPVAVTVRAPQPWEQGVRLECAGQRDTVSSLEVRINQQATLSARQGWELTSASLGRFGNQDCVALAYRRPIKP